MEHFRGKARQLYKYRMTTAIDQLEHKHAQESKERGERIMKRVGTRWLNRELSDVYRAWHNLTSRITYRTVCRATTHQMTSAKC